MSQESRAAALKRIISDVMMDGAVHSYSELKAIILEKDPTLLPKPNVLSTALYRMMKRDPGLKRVGKADYQYDLFPMECETTPLPAADQECWAGEIIPSPAAAGQEILAQILELAGELEQTLKRPSYDMSEAEFSQCRKLYQLSREIQRAIARAT